MSERGSFTTQYFYNEQDYFSIRNALDLDDKYLCISPRAKWGTHEMPIVSGKVGSIFSHGEWETVAESISGIKTEESVRIVVLTDAGAVYLIRKSPEGAVRVNRMVRTSDGVFYGLPTGSKHTEDRTDEMPE